MRRRLPALLLALLFAVPASAQFCTSSTGVPLTGSGGVPLICSAIPGGPTGGPASDAYPRIFAYADYGGSLTEYTSTAFLGLAPGYNAIVFNGYVGGSLGGANTYATVFAAIKAASPLATPTRMGMYIQSVAATPTASESAATFNAWTSQVTTSNWWLRTSWPSGAQIEWDGYSYLNALLLGPNNINTNGSGRNFFQQFAYHFDNYWALANADGETSAPTANPTLNLYFLDNQLARPRTSGTWGAQSDTTPYTIPNTQATTYNQQGNAKLVAAWRAQHPGIVIAGNNNYWAVGSVSGGGVTLDSSNAGLDDYAFVEQVEGDMPYYTASQLFNMVKQEESLVSSTGTVVVGNYFNGSGGAGVSWTSGAQSTWTTAGGQWQVARAMAAMAAMRNWTWGPGTGAGNVLYWFDEYQQGIGSFNGSPGAPGWLSRGTQRLDPPQNCPSSPITLTGTGNLAGVCVRRFPGGWVIWNRYGNGPVTITSIPSTLFRLTNISSSTGDPTINTGAQVTGGSVTLGDTCGPSNEACGDGLFLIGTG